ncbi:ABC transporter ATP-binding protein [Candidatus Fermentibacterales bacterium]|nr:ABC transporter ATP-binding protein [Candidatus Fermentibacterales bacterium]
METNAPARRKLILRAVRIVWHSSPALALANVFLLLVQGVLPVAGLYLLKLTVDSLQGLATGEGGPAFGHVALLIGLMGAAALLGALASSLSSLVSNVQARVVTDRMQDVLHERSVSVDLSYYEDSRFHDTLHRAQTEGPYRPTSIVNGLVRSLQELVSLLAMTGLLLTFHWAVALVLVAAAAPGTLVRMRYARELWTWKMDRTETERRAWYEHWLMTSTAHAKELRLFGLGDFFRERYRDLRALLRKEMMGMAKRRALSELGAQGSATVLVYGSLAFIAWRALSGTISIGDVVMYFQAFQRGLGSLRGLLNSIAGLYEDSLYLSSLYDFLGMRPDIASPDAPAPFTGSGDCGISFRGITFGYPGTGEAVLRDLDLEVLPGETLALVGANGSGKTTLVKLLCRLYDPDRGRIGIGGVALRDLDLVELRSHISVVFQDFARYQLSARENIAIADTGAMEDLPRVRGAAATAGMDDLLSALPEGYETRLGKWFKGGTELSDGEWQKMALARAFFRSADIVVLDEPTASLDARSEREVFRRFSELAGGRTALLISHRFSSVRICDRIAVLDGGRIAELGTHQDLMRLGGLYAEMYSISAEAYDRS